MNPLRFLLIPCVLSITPLTLRAQYPKAERHPKPLINLGVSVGAGGGYAFHWVPGLSIKVWRFTLSGSGRWLYNGDFSRAFQLEGDIVPLKVRGKWDNYISLALGTKRTDYFYRYSSPSLIDMHHLLLGANFYRKETPYMLGIKMGALEYQDRRSGTKTYYPYGSLTMRVFLEKNLTREEGSRGYSSDWKTFRAKYFNSHVSFGLGGAHPLFFIPYFGIRSGNFSFDLGVFPYPFLSTGLQLQADVVQIKATEKYNCYLTLTPGYTAILSSEGTNLRMIYALAGLNKMRKLGKHSWNFKAGLGKDITANDFSPPNNKLWPYAQISYTIFRHRFVN